MVSYKYLRERGMGHFCLNCLNRRYNLKLKMEDCIFGYYKYPCDQCGQMKNIVTGIVLTSRWKLLFGKKR